MRKKFKLTLFLLVVIFYSANSQNAISLAGFGEIPYIKNSNKFTVQFKDYGSFDFTGTIQPLSLETKVEIGQLEKLPGYKILTLLELEEIMLRIKPDSFILEAKANTQKRLKNLCDAFKITAPYINYSAKIGPRQLALASELDFSEAPIIIDVSEKTGTRFTLEKLGMGADVDLGDDIELTLGVSTEFKIRPTKQDTDLSTVMELSYNLMTQEITGAGSMTDTWTDPFGISTYVKIKKDAISYSNTAVSMGWIPGSPTPTTIGFAVGKASFFGQEFGAAMSVAPAGGEIALEAHRSRMAMSDFQVILKDGFGLNVPDIFPDDIYIDSLDVLFSPNGGEIGEYEIEPGLSFRGGYKLSDIISGSLDFYANTENGFFFEMNFDAVKLFEMIDAEVQKIGNAQIRFVVEKALTTLRIDQVYLLLEADMDMNMHGATHCKLKVFGKDVAFSFEASLSPKAIVDNIIEKLKTQGLSYFENVGKQIASIAGPAANAAINTARDGLNKALGLATEYASHTGHNHSDCLEHCSPGRGNELSDPVLAASDKAIAEFYNKIMPKLSELKGATPYQTAVMRSKYMKEDWKRVTVSIDKNWERVFYDEQYKGYSVFPERVTQYGNRFRQTVNDKFQQHIDYRNKLWDKLMTEGIGVKLIKNRYRKSFVNIQRGLTACTKIDGNSNAHWILEEVPGTEFVYIKNVKDGTLMNIENGKLECNKIGLGAHSAQWKMERLGEYIRFKNRWKGTYLNTEKYFESSNIGIGAHSSHWEIIPVRNNKAWNTNGNLTWNPGETVLQSNNGLYTLVFQTDGNLVLYRYADEVVWASGTDNKGAEGFRFQTDGNLVIYGKNNSLVWASNSHNKGGQTLVLEDNGEFVIHAPGARTVWSSVGNELWNSIGDRRFIPGQNVLKSTNGIFSLVFQKDGNLLLLKNGNVIWNSGTHYRGVRELSFQKDGNLCIRTAPDKIIWATNSYNKGGYAIVLENGGNCVIVAPNWNVLWATNTHRK